MKIIFAPYIRENAPSSLHVKTKGGKKKPLYWEAKSVLHDSWDNAWQRLHVQDYLWDGPLAFMHCAYLLYMDKQVDLQCNDSIALQTVSSKRKGFAMFVWVVLVTFSATYVGCGRFDDFKIAHIGRARQCVCYFLHVDVCVGN